MDRSMDTSQDMDNYYVDMDSNTQDMDTRYDQQRVVVTNSDL